MHQNRHHSFISRIALMLFLTGPAISNAHPVSFKGAQSLMSYNTHQSSEVLLTYSFNFNYAAGLTYMNQSSSEFYIPRFNYLVKRWNNEDSQANIYFSAGAGLEKYNSENYDVQLADLAIDWESRKYYISLENFYLNRDNTLNLLIPQKDYLHTKFRLGFAPFLADYQDLNVWYIAQFDKHNDNETENPNLTQFLRFYIRNVLWEIGSDLNGNTAFNLMIHL